MVFRGKTIIIEVGFFFCGVVGVGVAGGVGGGVGGVGGAAVHRRSKLLKMTEEI